ncbi:AbrB family transcriptional regulator [Gracilibacillus sp. YIM 98692]|uniref:AbrB family transcriptional regulator n=1 Tax=Gracilibacillus sp. YIM 98692 TaxID=2663532 RepID=UPI0013D5081D|nr:AbrB family transcriptional regulator [Gracilibacillus sp. YIM 98692]
MYFPFKNYFILYSVSCIVAFIFLVLYIPLAWILGPLLVVMFIQIFTKLDMVLHPALKNVSFVITGVQIGATFTASTLGKVIPYFIPFLFFTFLIIGICIISGMLLSKYSSIKTSTSVLGSVPGGLSVMVAMSDSYNANTGLVAIFHTIRLLTVIFIVPFLATILFAKSETIQEIHTSNTLSGPWWTVLIYFVTIWIAYLFRNKVPASFVLIPMFIIALIYIIDFPIIDVHPSLYHFAQLTIGIHLGLSIKLHDLKIAGKITWLFIVFSCFIILLSIVFGYIFSYFSELTAATAILSLAPGGLVEMAITANEVEADPAIVGSLQLFRMLFIILLLPIILKKYGLIKSEQ